MIRSKSSNLASILGTLLPVPPKYRFKGYGKTTAVKEQKIHNREVLRKVVVMAWLHVTCPGPGNGHAI